jgi:hypothetical protein
MVVSAPFRRNVGSVLQVWQCVKLLLSLLSAMQEAQCRTVSSRSAIGMLVAGCRGGDGVCGVGDGVV